MSIEDQAAFAARIRRPHVEPLPSGVSVERMAVYEELFFNNIEGVLSSTFPVTRGMLKDARWQWLVRNFIAGHRCRTPYFLHIGEEFIAWLQGGYPAEVDDPPYLLELAHYEWIELALDVADVELPVRGWSPLAWPLAYAWPVQRLGRDYRPAEPPGEPTCLLAWRDTTDKVRFQQLSAFAYRLALRLQAGERSVDALLALAVESALEPDESYFTHARALLDDWQRQDILFPE